MSSLSPSGLERVAPRELESQPGQLLGRALRRARHGRFTVAQLSERSGVSAGLIGLIERGKGNPAINTIGAIATALDVPLHALIEAAMRGTLAPGDDPPLADAAQPPVGPAAIGPEVFGPGPGAASAGAATVGTALATVGSGAEIIDPAAEGSASAHAGWESSIVLGSGQEARVQVLEGMLEMTLRDAAPPALPSYGSERRLSVDVAIRAAVPGLAAVVSEPYRGSPSGSDDVVRR